MASSSGSTKVCFNSTCKEALEVPRQGWLCRTGDFADLCDRCSSAFKDGKFCDTYHLNASGWRSCESCGKKIHCGCIVSFHMFILLDAGGIECLNCAKSEYISTPNPTWPSGTHFLPGHAERIKDLSSKNWRSIAGSGPIPWRQAPSLFNASKSIDKPLTNDSTGVHNLFQSFFTNERATPLSSLPATFVGQDKKTEKGILCPQTSVWKLRNPNNNSNNNNPPGTSLEAQNAKPRGRHQLLPRYWPRLTDQELQQISGGSNAKITPLFEKVLSASDAGRIGRLVLPKKCAEAYLPPISQPEGYPLVVQDLKGKDWVLQFRFWPNNNSRMYVLEGVTPCIQSMQLQAGDTVTFSRLEPEGKLVMGFRKAPPASPTNIPTHEESSKGNSGNYTKNPDGAWSEADKIPIHSKRKKALNTMCSNSKHIKLNVTLEQVQGLLRPPLTNPPTIVLIEGIEFEDYQEEPIIGSPTEHLPHTLPMSSATGFCKKNELEKAETVKTKEGLDALASLAIQDHNHKPGCTCVVCIQAPSGTNQNSVTEILYADIIRYNNNQMGENEAKKEKSVKTQNIDLNIQPEREEEASPVSESMGIIRLVQESTHRYIRQQKLSANGVIDKN